MFERKIWHWGVAVFASGIVLGGWLVAQESLLTSAVNEIEGALGVRIAHAQGSEEASVSPTKARARDVYYPNSEDLARDEMLVIACGTGMPTTRAAQAAAWAARVVGMPVPQAMTRISSEARFSLFG